MSGLVKKVILLGALISNTLLLSQNAIGEKISSESKFENNTQIQDSVKVENPIYKYDVCFGVFDSSSAYKRIGEVDPKLPLALRGNMGVYNYEEKYYVVLNVNTSLKSAEKIIKSYRGLGVCTLMENVDVEHMDNESTYMVIDLSRESFVKTYLNPSNNNEVKELFKKYAKARRDKYIKMDSEFIRDSYFSEKKERK